MCRSCYKHFYDIGDTQLVELCSLIKKGQDGSTARNFCDKAAGYKYSEIIRGSLNDLAHGSKIELNHQQIAAMEIPNTKSSLSLFG